MTLKDRTAEFLSAVESIQSRSGGPGSILPADRHALLSPTRSPRHAQPPQSKSEFARAAASIGRDINSTVTKLQKLARLAKRKTLFDDRPVEINELIYIIKQDIAKINQQIAQLSGWMRKHGGPNAGNANTGSSPTALASQANNNKQVREHSTIVISSLQSKLASTSNEFKNILEIRTENMKEQKNRRDQYSSFPAAGAAATNGGGIMGGPPPQGGIMNMGASPLDSSPLYNPSRRPTTPSNGDGAVIIDLSSNQQLQQQSLIPAPSSTLNMELIESRSQAIESIESTIAELGQIYQNFASMVATQREMVQRIDENVLDIEMNVEGAHSQLLKYYQGISSNRWLMMKVFAVLIVFFMMFVLVT
ncbi:t-SNARE [Fimicolochytrium jonesii]|uniref:t-SNARE n=1 Tax=Fimicolochytrium jonesii TaxID=1396493 RepID=UPI0022FE3C59|nr:t-SNARE [Fimicolochytrium jonesii]KAI8821865.1 t-SNARE [Fimicolochytrium jonesii]